jgi:microsomal dipeptidase-like Zn-dependent dipeptidase
MRLSPTLAATALTCLAVAGCGDDSFVRQPDAPAHDSLFALNDGCFVMDAARPGTRNTRYLVRTVDGLGYEFAGRTPDEAVLLRLKASDLGTYLLYDQDRQYVVTEADGETGATLLRAASVLQTDVELLDDTFISPAEWDLSVSEHDAERFALRGRATGLFMSQAGTTEDAAEAGVITLSPAEGCAPFPELTVDATGSVGRTTFDDGDLYGFVDAHSHLLTNFGFGGGGIFHGSPFHRLGVEAALPDCQRFHGLEGRRDLVGYFFDGNATLDVGTLATALVLGRVPVATHDTRGYPDFVDWPNAGGSSTHQTQYYRWLERAYLGGLRLVVQHATGNQVLCDLVVGSNAQAVRYSCNDMVGVDREIDEAYAMERYIDAQSGGPGEGWFRIVTSPAEAREVIEDGKLAVVLGIEISNVLDCFVTPREGFPACDAAFVRQQLTRYHDRGVRALFPVHKYDNGFSAGDGSRGFIELGNVINSGHYSNFTLDCDLGPPSVFDRGDVQFGGFNMPRAEYFSDPPLDVTTFARAPSGTVLPFLEQISEPPLVGQYCQNSGLQPMGELLLAEMMLRGMIIEVDHLPRRSFIRAYEILEAADYPAAGTHGNTNNGRIYDIGGISTTGLGRCQAADRVGAMGDALRNRIQLITDHGGYPAEGFGFDLNGFAGARGPRFGPDGCGTPQTNPITYPFTSYAGDVTFEAPQLGSRAVDFNTEGMIHVGLVPELIEDARHDGVTDEELEPLFRSAEAYVRMWERAELRAAAMRAAAP